MRKDEFLKLGLDEETAKKCEAASLAELESFVAKVDAEGMKKQIAELQAENKKKDEAHLAELAKIKIDTAIEAAIGSAKGKNAKAIKALLDLDKVTLDKDGNITGCKEQLETLLKAEDSKFLFDSAGSKFKGAKPAESGTENPHSETDLAKMSYEDFAAAENE